MTVPDQPDHASRTALAMLRDIGVALSAELDLSRPLHPIVRSAIRLCRAVYGSFLERAADGRTD